MTFSHFSHNGQLLPIDQAVIPLNDVEYSYGFGVYESIRVSKGTIYFADEHCRRLLESARQINLEHTFSADSIEASVRQLLKANSADTCNIKILLIGGRDQDSANLYIMCLNPLFPDRSLYKTGAHAITETYERPFPQAKTLNMLPSYLAFRHARQAGAYDALLVNRHGQITEGTRTNFFALKGRTITTPAAAEVLPGVTRHHVLEVAKANGFKVTEQPIKLSEVSGYDAVFLTSTSAKILPLRSIDKHVWETQPDSLVDLMSAFREFLKG